MASPLRIEFGDLVEFKKGHPCGSNQWQVVRTGMDIKLRCQGCGRYVTLPRQRLERRLRRLLHSANPNRSETTDAEGPG